MENLVEKWNDVLSILKEEIPDTSFDTWVLPLVPSVYENNKIILLSPYGFTAQTLKLSYSNVISQALLKVFGEPVSFEILQDKNLEEQYKKEQKKEQKKVQQEQQKLNLQTIENKYDNLKQMLSECNLNTNYQFDNFIVGEYNKLAYGAAYGVAKGQKRFNPLFIYGGSGLGKTHLMQAIGNYILTKGKGKVRYVTTEEFMNDLLDNLFKDMEKDSFKKGPEKNKRMTKFRQKYRGVDVLLIDDIQFIEGKEKTEIELFNIFNTLYQGGKQIVFTSDRKPADIPGISDRLKTRFECGLMADIGMPDLETRMVILKRWSKQEDNIDLSADVIEFLAKIYKNNIRELQGAYNKVCAYCSTYETEPTLEIVKKAINYNSVAKQITGMKIVEKIADFFGLKAKDICGSSRVGNIAYARKIAVYIIRELTGESWQSIGAVLGGRKYTTMMYSYDEIKKLMLTNDKLSQEINTLFNIINQM